MKDRALTSRPSKIATVEQVSAGGAAFRRNGDLIEVAIVAIEPSRRWQLPKGIIDEGETPEIAAVREVREEAGIETDLFEKIETVEYWFYGLKNGERVRFHKLVHFYLMKYCSGDVADHDHEVAEARWVEPPNAIEMLAFKNEKNVIEKALTMLPKFM